MSFMMQKLEFYEGNGDSFLLYILFDLKCQILINKYDFSKNKYYSRSFSL